MRRTVHFVKGSLIGRWLVIALCTLLLVATTPRKVEATAVEYAVMLALIIVVCITAIDDGAPPHAVNHISDQLSAAALDAENANSEGDTPGEIAGLSKAIGLTHALLGMLADCNDCDDAKSDAQDLIDVATVLKAEALNGSGGCNPNAIVCF